MSTSAHTREAGHPTPAKYVAIAVILFVVTVVEVAIVYLDIATAFLISALIVLSAAKFTLVAMFFMHLKFDSRLFSAFFVGGMLLTTGVILALMALFGTLVS